MEYPKRSINGDAGEYLVAYRITKLFGWPCRLYGVDLGVDAEIEIIDDASSSTGDIIKVQIKSFDSISSSDAKSVYVSDRHINYWKRFCLPVIVCCVDLKSEKIYWKQVTATEAYASSGESKKVSFNLTQDELEISVKDKLNRLVAPDNSKRIASLFDELDTIRKELPTPGTQYSDHESINKAERLCDELTKKVKEIEGLIIHFPWRISTLDLRKLDSIKKRVNRIENNISYSHNSDLNGM